MIMLAKDGVSNAQIVISANPSPVERHAAEELQRYLEMMSGAKLPVERVSAQDRPNIYIGVCAPSAGLDLSAAALGFDGYLVKTVGNDIILAGVQPYSCLYAVYHLLERHLGCGFFEDGDQVPKRATIEIGETNDVCKPRFDWRIYFICTQDAYSSVRWWDWEQFKPFVEWMAKKRFNMWNTQRLAEFCGITALAATRLGVPIELTPWQQKRVEVLRKVFEYARMMGIRNIYHLTPLYASDQLGAPGTFAYTDPKQLEAFVEGYAKTTGQQIPVISHSWCNAKFPVLDPRHPGTQKFIAACVQTYNEIFPSDHLFAVKLPEEWDFSGDRDEMNRITSSMMREVIKAIKEGDPAATVISTFPYAYGQTFEVQKQAIREAGLTIMGDPWLNQETRLHDFMQCDYYWNLPWVTGMTLLCGRHTNPLGSLKAAIRNAQTLATDPRTANCIGFRYSTEVNHRDLIMADLFFELSWNPMDVEPEDFLARWTSRRYGADSAKRLLPAVKAIEATLLSSWNMDTTNGPLYRFWKEGYLPGLTPTSVKRSLCYLPKLHAALELLLAEHDRLKDSPLYRFDAVDFGRTYLAAIFNDRLARARKAFRARDGIGFERNAREVEEVMRFMALYCSAHPQFRLKTHDEWAAQWPQMLPGIPNAHSNWINFTSLIPLEQSWALLDYMAEDFAEIVEHYFLPRVLLYLRKMRELLKVGKDISGRLVYRQSDNDLPNRIGDFAPPKGKLEWSAYGATCEPELTAGDFDLAREIIDRGTPSGRFDFYNGPMNKLLRDLLERYPVPEDLAQILSEPDALASTLSEQVLKGKPGDKISGFRTPAPVEKVRIPREIDSVVAVEELGREYNLMRGNITSCNVVITDFVVLTRLPDEQADLGEHQVATFAFEVLGGKYKLRYDVGSQHSPAGLFIERL
ncbi:MAG: alpha-N-acetylglucosaminidase C-terminal domain-containing protein [Verrucomicrobia bacterium]|nr:alpha-N-acetylglucosaminidase C-terminal domain-containing protein [Verrucomicrobiota bacterium]MCG2681258.1 alpha-N-acetylglucosaminidase C-terminal domain-containing protein [Kiritimatiellia bacterium]MBU4246926.1 alpha-N-acetylglucosaminidase C-terminal domain-containing protein [Verrucomicrobiota bacterium]MBU4291594.1 alpha-N-acetylglucosaminidase C-terminal domain-containing protein [Verrucomicrobiota bacterium]MBU4428313.1 alpha-N-acetylglucosaminidase C-terminal domain-containing pro